MKCKDGRLKLMVELLSGIRVVKLCAYHHVWLPRLRVIHVLKPSISTCADAWELFFLGKIDNVRQRELRNLKRYGYLSAITTFTWACTPFLVAFSSFGLYSAPTTAHL